MTDEMREEEKENDGGSVGRKDGRRSSGAVKGGREPTESNCTVVMGERCIGEYGMFEYQHCDNNSIKIFSINNYLISS